MFGKVLIVIAGFFTLGAIIISVSHHVRTVRIGQRIADWLKFVIYLLIILALVLTAWGGRGATAAVLALIAAAGGYELYRNLPTRKKTCAACSVAFALGIAACLGHVLLGHSDTWATTFIFMLLLICVTDSYSQLWGKLLGRRKLRPKISPGKTREGLIGGVLTTVAAVYAVSFLAPDFSVTQLTLAAVTIAVAATIGDPTFSLIKRRLGIKDFSGVLPGHGGVLERFDSLILTAPIFYWTRHLWLN